MSNRHLRHCGVAVLAATLIIGSGVLPVRTAAVGYSNAGSTNAIRVSPALSNIQLSTGETSTTIVAMVSNLTSAPLAISMTARDFTASPVSASTVSFYGKEYSPATNSHSLQTAISFASSQVNLAPHTTQKVAITLSGVDKLAAGGHYGAVLFSPAARAAAGSHTKVAINSAVASLVFLKTATGGTQTLRLVPLSTGVLRFSLPATNYIAFNDTGNTQSTPQGQLTLYGPGGSIVSTTVVNSGSGLILPGTTRLFTTPLPLPHSWLDRPGMYRLELQYRDSTQNTFTVVNQRFFYLNLTLIIPLLVLLALVIYTLRKGGRKLLRLGKRLTAWAWHRLKRKQPEPEPPKKPKRPRLIQG